MGLFKRKNVWWMRFTYKRRQIRRSTEMTEKKLAEQVYHTLRHQIAEGKSLESPRGRIKHYRIFSISILRIIPLRIKRLKVCKLKRV